MQIGLGLIVFFFLSQAAVVLEALDSWRNQIFLPTQMMGRYGRPGVNFLTHGGMWSDMFVLPYVLCIMLANSDEWSMRRDWLPILLGIAITAANQLLLNNSPRPDPLGSRHLKWSLAIAVHAVYMGVYIAIIGHFYFNSTASPAILYLVTVAVGIHIAAGTHVFLGVANVVEDWTWCPDIFADRMLYIMNGAVWFLLAALAAYADSWQIGVAVVTTGALFALCVSVAVWSLRTFCDAFC